MRRAHAENFRRDRQQGLQVERTGQAKTNQRRRLGLPRFNRLPELPRQQV
jgi:hypothetical protein